jgi:hypothetical protein
MSGTLNFAPNIRFIVRVALLGAIEGRGHFSGGLIIRCQCPRDSCPAETNFY